MLFKVILTINYTLCEVLVYTNYRRKHSEAIKKFIGSYNIRNDLIR